MSSSGEVSGVSILKHVYCSPGHPGDLRVDAPSLPWKHSGDSILKPVRVSITYPLDLCK
jgi:hypothetical protein